VLGCHCACVLAEDRGHRQETAKRPRKNPIAARGIEAPHALAARGGHRANAAPAWVSRNDGRADRGGRGDNPHNFYKYFKSKSDVIHFLQEAFIEPEMVAISVRLDQIASLTWQSLRDWLTDYSRTWERIHLFLEAYNDALLTDPAVAATAIPNTHRVTSNMTHILSRFSGEERERAHGKLVILLSMASQMLSLAHAQREEARNSRLLDGFTDLFWQGFFKELPRPSGTSSKKP